MTCPKCSTQQIKSDSCSHCGIVIEKFLATEKITTTSKKEGESANQGNPEASFNQANYRKALKSSNVFKQLKFVQDELKDLPGIDKKPSGGVSGFFPEWDMGFRSL
jgi:hypothetical protein